MKSQFDEISIRCSELTTKAYSTSFTLGIQLLSRKFHRPIYAIYGFVRFADEIVDSFHDFDKVALLKKFRSDTEDAIESKISLNPVLNAFQAVVNLYGIEYELIDTFLRSMEMDLEKTDYERNSFEEYILGSAEVVGLMCLRVFCEGNNEMYQQLKPSAMKLGAAFQKINFLRDIQKDYKELGRSYFPGIDLETFSEKDKKTIEEEIQSDFQEALIGIKQLPLSARRGVYLAYIYYYKLFEKIKRTSSGRIMKERIRISNGRKFRLMINSMMRLQAGIL